MAKNILHIIKIIKSLPSRKIITGRRFFLLAILLALFLLAIKARPNYQQAKAAALPTQTVNQTTTQTIIPPAKATFKINEAFTFPVTDASLKDLGKIDYYLDNAELRNQIVVKGETATAIKGKTFLIINLKLTNSQNNPIALNTRNYIRLSLNGNGKEWLAPDIYNDPVEVQPISTKLTRLGFPISDTDNKLKLQIGEINGSKTILELKF